MNNFWLKDDIGSDMAKKKTNDDFYAEIAKATGGISLAEAGNVPYFINTGSLALNYICSGLFINGGIPGGRITEFYGPPATAKSLLGYACLASAQRMDGIAVLLDCERAGSADFASAAGHVDCERLITYEPVSIEQVEAKLIAATRAIRKYYGPEKPILFVWDSIGVTPTEREWKEVDLPENPSAADIKKAGGNARPGERAKASGDLLRKINPFMNEQNATMFIINQTRKNIGVLYGCFHYNTRVTLADGTSMKIGKIVNQNLVGLEVLSFNPETRKIEKKKIVQTHNNGNIGDDEFIQFVVRKRGGNGRTNFACTSNHLIFRNNIDRELEEIPAGRLEVGDKILTIQPYYLSDAQKQLICGSILGDGSIRPGKYDDSCSSFRICHGTEQIDYCYWKREIMNPWVAYTYEEEKKNGFDTIPMHELTEMKFRENDRCVVPDYVLNNLDAFGLAIWYMDDGTYAGSYKKHGNGKSTLYCSKFDNRTDLVDMLDSKFGLKCKLKPKGLFFDSENTRKLHEIIAKYIHPSMNYKIHPSLRDQFNYQIEEVDEDEILYQAVESDILDIYEKPRTKSRIKFDLTIEDNASYIVDGAIVHNSPETTPGGGEALKFYASCRLRTSIGKYIENKTGLPLGINLNFANKKSRSFVPGIKTTGVQLFFQHGINPLGGLLSILLQAGRIENYAKGRYKVLEPWADGQDVTFQARVADNDVPIELLLKAPKIIDAKDEREVQAYLNLFDGAIQLATGDSIVEKAPTEEDSPDFINELKSDESDE